MRAILLILILAVVAVIAAIATGFVDINQTRPAKAPNISASREGVAASGGQSPQFQVETGSVQVGAGEANVATPRVRIEPGQTKVPVPKVTVQRPVKQPPATPVPAQ